MIVRKRILEIRKQSRITFPKENLWFLSENKAVDQSPVTQRKSDRLSILNEDYDLYSLENSGRNRNNNDCRFVVDWQMADAL